MYGSKSDKARMSGFDRDARSYWKSRNRRPVITAKMDTDEDAWLVEPQGGFDIDRLHAEALEMHAEFYDEQGEVEFWAEVDAEWNRLDKEDRREAEARYDEAYGGYSDDPDDGDSSGCWIPFMRLPELRDTFGDNWLGNGFHIVQGNAVRR